MTLPFAKRLFLLAGIYGLIVLPPMFFLEPFIAEHNPPAITHAEFYYGFVCCALAWQFVYLMMSRDPLRYLPMLLPATFGKAGFGLAVIILFAQGRYAAEHLLLPAIDLILAALFIWAYVSLRSHEPAKPTAG